MGEMVVCGPSAAGQFSGAGGLAVAVVVKRERGESYVQSIKVSTGIEAEGVHFNHQL